MKDASERDVSAEPLPGIEKPVSRILKPESVKSIRGEISPTSDWKDRGVIDVPVKDLPWPEDVTGTNDFDHHITWDDARSATLQLPEIQKDVNAGKTGDDFSAEDQAAGLDYAHGKRRIYDLYYGSEPVTLNKMGEEYAIISGRHRVFAAKELGLYTIPARVIEKIN